MHFHITCSTDNNYLQHCMAMLCSVLDNNKRHTITAHILHSELTEESLRLISELFAKYGQEVKVYDVSSNVMLENCKISHPHLSIAAYYRLVLTTLVNPDIDKMLYLDCDVVVLRDLEELMSLNIDNYGVAAINDCTPANNKHRMDIGTGLTDRMFCSGVMLLNLKYWRQHNCYEHFFDFIEKTNGELIFEDQDVLNHVFRNRWLQLPYKYGVTPMSVTPLDKCQKHFDFYEYRFQPVILHFASYTKPWLNVRVQHDKYYWHYAKLSGFPNVKETIAPAETCKKIRRLRTRYYISAYIRPLIPNIIEMIVKDIYYLLLFIFTCIFRPKRVKSLLLKMWLRKYI